MFVLAFQLDPSVVVYVAVGCFVLGYVLGRLSGPDPEAPPDENSISPEALGHILRLDSNKGQDL